MKYYLLFTLGLTVLISSCFHDYKNDLLSDDKNKIMKACYKLGEARDTSAVKFLFTKILDPRISNNLRFKGMSVSYCRLTALSKIAGLNPERKIKQYEVDTLAVYYFLDWAVKEHYLKDKDEVDIKYFKDTSK